MRKLLKIEFLIALLGFVSICSSWLSIRPSSEKRYQELIERSEQGPESVSSEEWVQSKDDEGFTALSLIFVGGIAFVVLTVAIFLTLLSLNHSNLRPLFFSLGFGWIFLGIALHAYLWLS